MSIKFISNVCVRLTKPMSDAATEITVRTDDALKLNQLGVGNYTYLVFSYNGNSEVVKYTHTATIPASTKNTVLMVERDVEATGVYSFPMKACGCVDTSASAVIDLATQSAGEQGTTLVDCSGNEVPDGAAVVLCATYNADKAAQGAAIATKVNAATYSLDQAVQDAAIASKVDTATYSADQASQDAAYKHDQAAQDAAIALKQNALNDCSGKPLAGTVPTCAQMNTAISSAIAGIAGGTSPTGAAGGDLEGTYPNPTVKDQAIVDAITGSTVVQTAVAGVFDNCAGTPLTPRSRLIECSAKGTDIPYLVSGVIPATQLPAYVDDVLEFPALANFPATGEAGKIYIDASTGKTYRWNGTGYTEISASAGITVQDEGSVLTTAATSLNFVGAGIQATSSGGAVTVTVPSATTTQSGTYTFSGNSRPTGTPVDNGGSSYAQNAAGELFFWNGTDWVLIGNGVFKLFGTTSKPAKSVPNDGTSNGVVIKKYTAPRQGVLIFTGHVRGTILIGDGSSPSRLTIDVTLTNNGIVDSGTSHSISYYAAGDGIWGTHTTIIYVMAGDLLELRCSMNCLDISNQEFLISKDNFYAQYIR